MQNSRRHTDTAATARTLVGQGEAVSAHQHHGQAKEAARHAAAVFVEKLRNTYDVAQVIMFGSRARGDNRPDSDLDLAVVLSGARGDFYDTKLAMASIAFDVMMQTGVLVQAFPLWDGDLAHPEESSNPALIRAIVGQGIRLG
jgi:predicted nucleotidyltransferase